MIEKTLTIAKKFIPKPVFHFFQPLYHFLMALSGNILFRFPGYKLKVIGVTGTNGKSTTAEIITEMLKASGKKVGMISTVYIEINGKRQNNSTNRTTLGRWRTQRLLRRMVNSNCEYAVIEVASEGIAWYRIFGIPFDVAVFTNLAPEHLNFHKTMENYRNTKGRLFAKLKSNWNFKKTKRISAVNADDSEAKYFLSFDADQKYTFGLRKGEVKGKNIKTGLDGTTYEIEYKTETVKVRTGAIGTFNVYNELAAYCVGLGLQLPKEFILKALTSFKGTIGRAERIEEGQNFSVIVDYAVTPDAQRAIYEELRKITKGNLISVFGATGDRDKQKRPGMGKTASFLTDQVILTDDETYNEESHQIIREVYAGVPKKLQGKVTIMPDRYQAIKKALNLAKGGDTVIISGIGHQKYRTMSSMKMPWNERAIVREILKFILKKSASEKKGAK